jgi:hypothetical protein
MPQKPRLRAFLRALLCLPLFACAAPAETEPPAGGDGYLKYVRNAPEFRRVRQDAALLAGRWDTWLYMPWRYRWTIGTGTEGGRFCRDHGINGGMTDHGQGPLPWLEKWGLRFYNDHTAGRGPLFLDPGGLGKTLPRDGRAVRPRPVDRRLLDELGALVVQRVRAVRGSPMRVAYALDDEISWGSFVRPVPWRIHADDAAYAAWLREYYRGETPPQPRYLTPDDVLPQLGRPLGEIDLSPFLDRMTYNDSVWANAIGELVERCNREDPSTPCGFVGGQAPSLWGGYDWAKLAKKVQFVEAYDLGSAQEILRSLLPAAPRVTTHFHDEGRGPGNDSWLAWRYFAHGNRGMIGWVGDEWFDPEGTPRPWLARFAPTLRELGGVQGPKIAGARWLDDGIALYYSHPSVQVSWVLDAEAHGRTWANRNDDHRLGTSHLVRKAWEAILTDAGLQYDFLAYDEVVATGVPREVRVLILPAAFALSDVEARRIAAFAESGGTVVADFAPGLFDQHGRGRRRGALDGLFGVSHDGRETRADFFGGRLWVETDQDAGYSYKRYRELFATVRPRLHQGYAVAERRLPVGTSRPAGHGRAVYLNLSPQRYLMLREEGTATPESRRPFLDPITAAGISPWMRAAPQGVDLPLEATAWSKGGRTLVFVLQNAAVTSTPRGGGGAEGLVEAEIPVEVRLAGPVRNVRDERTGRLLPDGDRFTFRLKTTEAVFFSFEGGRREPPSP